MFLLAEVVSGLAAKEVERLVLQFPQRIQVPPVVASFAARFVECFFGIQSTLCSGL